MADRPDNNNGLIRTSAEREPKTRRVAKFLILIGADRAAEVLSKLDEKQVEEISREIATIHGIRAEEADGILTEFGALLKSSYGISGQQAGGIDEARRILYKAFGPTQGEAIIKRSLPETEESPLAFLDDFSGKQIAFLLKDEGTAVKAMILSKLSSREAADTIATLPKAEQVDLAIRIAKMGPIASEALDAVAKSLRKKIEKLYHNGELKDTTPDGMNVLTQILKASDISFGDRLLQDLAWDAPELGKDLKERLYTLDDIVKAEDGPIEEKLATMEDRSIVYLLRRRSPQFQEKILSNVSTQRRTSIQEEDELVGPIPKKEADAVAQDFLDWFRRGRDRGTIILKDDEDILI
ncbi:MAG: flagellar motor switch protein FliG [Spirochaetaceae bacterium]|nr:flagellar motor switch protein FliG [Spirochaetaceae bacterium]